MPDLYRPSNGSEGECFESQFCERCEKDRHDDCPIHNEVFYAHVSQWIYDEDGEPTCTEFEEAKP